MQSRWKPTPSRLPTWRDEAVGSDRNQWPCPVLDAGLGLAVGRAGARIFIGRVSCRAAGYAERALDGLCCCCSGAVLGFELLGITSDLEGILRRCTTQVVPCGPAQVRPGSPSRVRLRCKGVPSQLPCVWRPANTMTEDRQSTSGGTHRRGPAMARIMPSSRARNPCPAGKFVSTSA